MEVHAGFFSFYYDPTTGHLWLAVDQWEKEFLYVNSLAAGMGSNDIGLDRGQLGDTRVVKFMRSGPKVLLMQPNYAYRATSDNPDERRAVEEAFAQSVLGGFEVAAASGDTVLIDITDFLLRDAHQVAQSLAAQGEGTYSPDPKRSVLYLPMTKNFSLNTEFEALITFSGKPTGTYLPTVTPSPEAVTVRQHHSFVQLPEAEYQTRQYDPRSGFYPLSYQDYATPISEPVARHLTARHRLKKKDPTAALSEAVEPIVYYVDRGAPEPIRSALIEGASWWNQAFEAAGYKNAFQVRLMPEDADPMDVRYNLIQWVHRATRGWSYGASVQDPRTGEIIKGHVSLGSLRVRQDYLIAVGLLAPYESGQAVSPELEEMALARLRQLSAHEVGHTLGLMHNFAASTNERASVMDYPHPFITLNDAGEITTAGAYAVGIGEWDKRAILYGYQDFPANTDEKQALWEILKKTQAMDLRYLSDRDARPAGSTHPDAHLWDNGADATVELQRLLTIRKQALARFGEKNIPERMPMATLEEVLVPLYFGHRYQVEAVAKVIGGMEYNYALRGDGQLTTQLIDPLIQLKALSALLATLEPEVLALPPHILPLIPPRPPGYERSRETLPLRTRFTADPLAGAASLANETLALLLHPERAARLVEFHARDPRQPGLEAVLDRLQEVLWPKNEEEKTPYLQAVTWEVRYAAVEHLMRLAMAPGPGRQVNALARQSLGKLNGQITRSLESISPPKDIANYRFLRHTITEFQENPQFWKPTSAPRMPDGSPIGCGGGY